MVKVLIVDDHALLRRVVREIIEKESDLEVVAEASNGEEAVTQAAQTQPDIVLMDLIMPVCDGFEATERVLACSPHSRILILTASQQEEHIFQAIQRGATGYITKDVEPDTLLHAIRSVIRDELYIPRPLVTRVLATLRSAHNIHNDSLLTSSSTRSYQISSRSRRTTTLEPVARDIRPLTERECEILDLIRKGSKNREIASTLSIAESTVHKHIQNIFEKLHARNRTEAIYLTKSNS